VLIWDVGQLLAVEFGNDELLCVSGWVKRCAGCSGSGGRAGYTYSMALAEGLDVHKGQRFLALEELKGRDLACNVLWCEPSRFLDQARAAPCRVKSLERRGRHTPLMILQKMQVAILLDMGA
jgi:hypothetical protein